ncbi:class I SAM-dependent methyltransferase [Bauldia sp.]|uniref:class I SAM-dependent methyltransferase n=1 Tax=Bauldia sp. TaxID=2575872 RepID=UPI003BA8EDF0
MSFDVVDLRAFYADRLGGIARGLIGARLKRVWPSMTGEQFVGIGYPTPYLPGLTDGAERRVAFMPAIQGAVNWPTDGANAVALVTDELLPLPDASVGRVLVIHGLETSGHPKDLLHEVRRILIPGGRLILVVPNRRGIWAWAEKTPFGHGRPYTRGQLTRLLRDAMLAPLEWTEALCAPPIAGRPWIGTGARWERIGVNLWPALAGVIIVEATKQFYQGVSIAAPARVPAAEPALRPAFDRPW